MTLEAVTEALVTMFTAALGAVPVFDGPTPTKQLPPVYLIVGSTGDDGEDAVVALPESDMGNHWTDESAELQCVVYAWAGNGTVAVQRNLAQPVVDTCRAALYADPTLSGVLKGGYKAWVTRVTRTQQQTSDGPVVKLAMTISYSNLLTPA